MCLTFKTTNTLKNQHKNILIGIFRYPKQNQSYPKSKRFNSQIKSFLSSKKSLVPQIGFFFPKFFFEKIQPYNVIYGSPFLTRKKIYLSHNENFATHELHNTQIDFFTTYFFCEFPS